MKKLTLFSALALCGLALSTGAQEKTQDKGSQEKGAQDKAKPVEAKPIEAAKPAAYKLGSTVDENLTLTDLDGKSLKFKDLRGKVVLLHFWSTTCPYEKTADPKFTELEKRWKDKKDVAMVTINANGTEIGPDAKDTASYDAIRKHMKEKNLAFPVYADHGNKVADMFQAQCTPHCFVLDKKGVIVYAGALDDDPKGDKGEATQHYARDAVEAVLAGQEVKVKESKPYGCSIKRVGT